MERKRNLFIVAALACFGIYAAVAYAGPTLREVEAFAVDCGATATRIRPADGFLSSNGLHAFSCFVSRASPDDSASCACIGGAGVDQSDECYPIGGCAAAENTQISVDGDAYCLTQTGDAGVMLRCLGGVGVP